LERKVVLVKAKWLESKVVLLVKAKWLENKTIESTIELMNQRCKEVTLT